MSLLPERRSQPRAPEPGTAIRRERRATPEWAVAYAVAGMASADPLALSRLYDLTIARVHALAACMTSNDDGANDVVAETYLYAWRTAKAFDPSRGLATTWLLLLCRSRALLAASPAQRTADDLAAALQPGSRVRIALETLPTVRREALALSFLQGRSHARIAQMLGLPIGTVKSHLRAAMRQLRVALEHDEARLARVKPLRHHGLEPIFSALAPSPPDAVPASLRAAIVRRVRAAPPDWRETAPAPAASTHQERRVTPR